MTFLRYITHPEVQVDLGSPAPTWSLSEVGRARAAGLLSQTWVADIRCVISSPENKALETAKVLAAHLGIEPETRPDSGRTTAPRPARYRLRSLVGSPIDSSRSPRRPSADGSEPSTRSDASPRP